MHPATVLKETPIEREIRRAIEREHSLRRSRGLPNRPTSPEYVEIPLRKAVLCQSSTAKSERSQGKDREYAGKKMQHEIHEEVRREDDLVKLGKVPGFYDKGTVRLLKERKQLFEAFQKPSESTLAILPKCKALSWSSASDHPTLEVQEDLSSQASHGQRSKDPASTLFHFSHGQWKTSKQLWKPVLVVCSNNFAPETIT
uniref:Uncharacterized protein n=1 Tax=Sphaeramia orbicularis TaxID=375764 RepID=A0A673CVZ3_9TELE